MMLLYTSTTIISISLFLAILLPGPVIKVEAHGAVEDRCTSYIHETTLPSSDQASIKIEYVSTDQTLSVRMTSDQQSYIGFGLSTSEF